MKIAAWIWTWCLLTLATNGIVAQDCSTLSWEANLTYQINSSTNEGFRGFSQVVSDALVPLSIATPVAFYAAGMLGANDDQETNIRSAQTGIQLVATTAVTYGVVVGLKALFDRERPFQAHPGCITGYDSSVDGSMPSGHSAGSAALATTLSLRYPHWYVVVPSVAYALYTGFTRLHLGMHYLSDVLIGYAIGVGVALGVNALNSALFDLTDPLLPEPSPPIIFGSAMVGSPVFSVSIPL